MGKHIGFSKPDKHFIVYATGEPHIGVLKVTEKELRELTLSTLRKLLEECLNYYFQMEVSVGIFEVVSTGFVVDCIGLIEGEQVPNVVTLKEVELYSTIVNNC